MATVYAYLAQFVGMMLEGEISLVAAAIAVYQGVLSMPGVIIVALIGTQLTDWSHFWIGKYAEKKILTRKPNLARKVHRVSQYIDKHPYFFLIVYRFIYGFRTVLPVAIGLSKISVAKFAVFSLLSTLLWACTYAALGYYFGEAIQPHIAWIKHHELQLLLGGVLLIVSAYLLHETVKRNKRKKEMALQKALP